MAPDELSSIRLAAPPGIALRIATGKSLTRIAGIVCVGAQAMTVSAMAGSRPKAMNLTSQAGAKVSASLKTIADALPIIVESDTAINSAAKAVGSVRALVALWSLEQASRRMA